MSIRERIGANPVVLALSVARLGDAVGNGILLVVLPLYIAELPAPWFPFPESVRVGILFGLYGLVTGLLQPLMGALSDRLDRRRLLIGSGMVLMAASTLALVLANNYALVLLLRALQGLGLAVTIPATVSLLALATGQRTRGGSMGTYTAMRLIGLGVGPLLGGLLQLYLGFDAAFCAGAGFVFLGAGVVYLRVRDLPADDRSTRSFRIVDRNLLSPGILAAGAATFAMAVAFSMPTTLESQFNSRLHETVLSFGIAFSALKLSQLVFQVPLGWLADQVGRKPLVIGGLLLIAPATALLSTVRTPFELVAVRAVQGLASAGIAAPALALAADLSTAGGQGRQMSILTMSFGLGLALGPLLGGLLNLVFFGLPFLAGAALALAAAWSVRHFVPETLQRDGRQPAVVPRPVSPADQGE